MEEHEIAVVSPDGLWAFIHIPKSGGHAFHAYLLWKGYLPGDYVSFGDYPEDWDGHPISIHASAAELKQWMRRTGRDWDLYTSIAVIRDPIDRVRSLYFELTTAENRELPYWSHASQGWWNAFDRCLDINDFVLRLLDPHGEQLLLRPQRWYVTEGDEIIVKRLVSRSHMSSMIPLIIGRTQGNMPRTRVRNKQNEYLADSSIEKIKRVYEEDFELFEAAEPQLAVKPR